MQEGIIAMTDLIKTDIDELQLFFGEPFIIKSEYGNDIPIYQPTIGDILRSGEKNVYSIVNTLVANTTMYRVQLWDMGIDWNKFEDFQLFCMLLPSLFQDATKLLFGDLDFQLFNLYKTDEDGEPSFFLYNKEQNVEITKATYYQISAYIKRMFNIYPKVEKARGRSTKEWIIFENRQKIELRKNEPYKSTLLPLISSCVNHPGFKYKKSELREVGIVEFMDSVQRLQVYESSTALLKGVYSGFVDTSKINKDDFNFMREISQQN